MKVHELFAYLHVKDAARAIDFYTTAFGAVEKFRLAEPSGRIGHAELDFGGSTLMLADEFPEYDLRGPTAFGATTVTLHIHVDDADEVIRRAVEAGASVIREPKDEFYGERSGRIRDPFGHEWSIGHHIEDIPADEMQRRYTELMREG
ncbi:MAG: VOC family protein [Gemmatimonadota bacterium]|nr:VOC family protein [Gemmatimonadota bacterium]